MTMQSRRVRRFASGLAALAGYVDVIGFLTVGGYFVSFMSGNSTRLAIDVSTDPSTAVLPGLLIVIFVAGVITGELSARRCEVQRARRVLSIVTLLLTLAALSAACRMEWCEGFTTAMAMGAMNTVFSHSRRLPVGMTYMTGALVAFGRAIVAIDPAEQKNARYFLLHWCALVSGGVVGALMHRVIGGQALVIAVVAALALLIVQSDPENLS